jgi:hypothetical protein
MELRKAVELALKGGVGSGITGHTTVRPDTDYAYHVTSHENAEDIQANGLKPHRPSFRQEQAEWPTRAGGTGREPRTYFAASEQATEKFLPEESMHHNMTLRVLRDHLRELGGRNESSDAFVRSKIHPSRIEYKTKDGWKPMQLFSHDDAHLK